MHLIWSPGLCCSEEGEGEEAGVDKTGDVDEAETQSDEASLLKDSNASAAMWRPSTVSEFRFMMDEQEFNIRLVEVKTDVSSL